MLTAMRRRRRGGGEEEEHFFNMVTKRKAPGLPNNFSYLANLLMLKISSLTRKYKLLMYNSSRYLKIFMYSLIKWSFTELGMKYHVRYKVVKDECGMHFYPQSREYTTSRSETQLIPKLLFLLVKNKWQVERSTYTTV